jgi:hypothetical protein
MQAGVETLGPDYASAQEAEWRRRRWRAAGVRDGGGSRVSSDKVEKGRRGSMAVEAAPPPPS